MSDEFRLKFVKPKEGEIDSRLLEASKLLEEHDLEPSWLEQDECLEVEGSSKHHAYIIEPFYGPAFQHLKLLGCRVFGPQCVLASLNFKLELPQKTYPIHNVCMKGVTVSCTSLDIQARDEVYSLVKLMAGEISRNFTGEVTHVVAAQVGSEKYAVAGSRGIPIMCVEWIKDVWDIAQHRYVNGTEPELIKKYRCPVFKGLVVTVSGLSTEERINVKKLVEAEGGAYTGEMKMNECTHLIIKEPRGQKYDYASKWNMHIVSLKWVYASLDSNYCLAEKDFRPTAQPSSSSSSSGLKTSTPEKHRLSHLNPNMGDISAISTTHIDETVGNYTRLSCALGNADNDVTSTLPEPVLDGCRVYLSEAILGGMLDRCKKIINSTGATRFSVINESVTHVVMEDKVDREITLVNDLDLRPHVVSPGWLLECARQGCRVSEHDFLSPHLLPSELELPAMSAPKRVSEKKGKPAESGEEKEVTLTEGAVTTHAGDRDMVQLLSQYMDNGTLVQEDEVDGHTSTSTHHTQDDETQDPCDDPTIAEGGVFGGKSFMFFGFADDVVDTLAEYVTHAGGQCLRGTRKVPDYGVVPIPGFPVPHTVGHVVTNAWLQMCLESDELLAVDSNVIFEPMDIDEVSRPLEGCVLSISGYSGVERDCLNHIADLLGAVCQEYFARKAKKTLKASTHLIIKDPDGPKYTAAKNWDLPALTKEWLFACAKSGQREAESEFHIDNMFSTAPTYSQQKPATLTPAKAAMPQGADAQPSSTTDCPDPKSPMSVSAEPKDVDSGVKSCGDDGNAVDEKPSSPHPSLATLPTKPPSHSKDTNAVKTSVPQSSPDSVTRDNIPTSSISDREHSQARSCDLNDPMGSVKAMVQRSGGRGSESQKENLTSRANRRGRGKVGTTPRGEKKAVSKVEELRQQSSRLVLSPGADSPSVFMAPGYRPQFNMTAVFEYLKTPDPPQNKVDSPSLDELIQYHLAEGVKNSAVPQNTDLLPACSQSQSSQSEDTGPLQGVIISVSKKLGARQTEYNTMVVELGGDYSWQYSASCTHFIFQGRANDLNKEFRTAKNQGKFVVSPHWLYACMDERCRVEEAMYPHNYNPNLNLGNMVRTETPGRGLRRSARSTPRATALTPARPPQSPKSMTRAAQAWNSSVQEMKSWQTHNKTDKHSTDKDSTDKHSTDTNSADKSSTNKNSDKYSADKTSDKTCTVKTSDKTSDKTSNRTSSKTSADKNKTSGNHTSTDKTSSDTSTDDTSDDKTSMDKISAKSSNHKTTTDSTPHMASKDKTPASRVSNRASREAVKKGGGGAGQSGNAGRTRAQSAGDKTGIKPQTNAQHAGKGAMTRKKKISSSSSSSSCDEKSSDKEEEDVDDKEGAPGEAGGSLEIRQALSKTLETVKASTSHPRRSSKKKNKREGSSSGGQANVSDNVSESGTNHNASPWQTKPRTPEGPVYTESVGTEASQSVQITWDDPTGRREQERLAHKLDLAGGPSQSIENTEDFMANMDMPDMDTSPADKSSEGRPGRQEPVRSPTPEAPPLAFPTAQPVCRVSSPQPIELVSEGESGDDQPPPAPKPIILTSGMGPQERIEYAAVIEALGGTVLDKQQFDPSCTHLVVCKPTRNEKFLAAVATGRWVLHQSYLIACKQESRFVNEEDHEWGNPAMTHLMQSLDTQTHSLVKAAYKWRHKLHALRKTAGGDHGAFEGWRVILLTETKREDNFRRLLTAGGATVLSVRPPFTDLEATHCFVEMHRIKLSESDLEVLVKGVTHILKPEFIVAHLTDDPPPLPHSFTPADVERVRVRCLGDQSRKRRKDVAGETERGKRSRR